MFKYDFFYIFTLIKSSTRNKFYRPTLNRELKNQTSHACPPISKKTVLFDLTVSN